MSGDSFEERKSQLSPLEYQVVCNKATERPFSNKYNRHFEVGVYHCVVCNQELFKSETKFASKSGWPAFHSVVDTDRVKLKPDTSHVGGGNLLLLITRPDLARTEVSCSTCGVHLGHLFKDGPKPTGLRYCINSASLSFVPETTTSNTSSVVQIKHEKVVNDCTTSGKLCFFASSEKDRGIQRISTAPRPLRETSL